MARINIVNTLLNVVGAFYSDKIVAIYNSLNQEVLQDCAIIDCVVKDTARLMEHPIETGAKIVDHKVFEPRQVQIQLALTESNYQQEYEQLSFLYHNCEMLSVRTKAQIYSNMQIIGIPHEEKVNKIDRLILAIQLKEAMLVSPDYIKPKKGKGTGPNSNTQKKGTVKPTEKTTFNKIVTGVKDAFKSIGESLNL